MLKYLKKTLELWQRSTIVPDSRLVVVVTGCDSGLGFMMARVARRLGLTVVGGLLRGPDGEGGRRLRSLDPDTKLLHLLELDVTKQDSVDSMKNYVQDLLRKNPSKILHAVVNNAGVMAIGDFEWQTTRMLEEQLMVNVLGTWRVSRSLLGFLRGAAGAGGAPRLVTVSSHCGLQPLRTMGPYSASKSALKGWTEAIRMELRYYGVHVVNYIPGGMVASTNILTQQAKYVAEMKSSFNSEQRLFYEEYFQRFVSYISLIGNGSTKAPDQLLDSDLEKMFISALLDEKPRNVYKNQSWRYAFYYSLFKICPTSIRYWLVDKFLLMPKYNPTNNALK